LLPKSADIKSIKRHLSTLKITLIVVIVQKTARGMKGMLKVPQQEYIKYLREIEDLSITEIKEHMNVNWRTAKKYADKDNWNKPLIRKARVSPVMDPFKEIIDTWLQEDQLIPKKQRHTAQRIFDRLCKEHNFKGGYRTVCTYVNKTKTAMKLETVEVYQRLEHPKAEAQVDFYTTKVSKNSELIDYKVLVLSFPYSNAAFIHPVPAENQECFLEALKKVFEKAGGVPHTIWFDNLSAAVVNVEKEGNRTLTESFSRFKCHYGFNAVFCNPARGNEKGNVENKCGYTRRNFCVPVPVFDGQEALEQDLDKRTLEDMDRPHYEKDEKISDLWKCEKEYLKKLPEQTYDIFRIENATVNNYGEIKMDKVNITVFGAKPGQCLPVKLTWDKIVVMDNEYKTLTIMPRPYTNKVQQLPWPEIFKGYLRKPRSTSHSQFTKMLPEKLRKYITTDIITDRKERLAACVNWASIYGVEQIDDTISKLGENVTIEAITAALHFDNGHKLGYRRDFEDLYTPNEIKQLSANLKKYDLLGKAGV
jgi:transposase